MTTLRKRSSNEPVTQFVERCHRSTVVGKDHHCVFPVFNAYLILGRNEKEISGDLPGGGHHINFILEAMRIFVSEKLPCLNHVSTRYRKVLVRQQIVDQHF